jgi:membrane protein
VRIARTLWHRYLDEDVSTLAAGIGLFALLALPAALVAIAAIYGLVVSDQDVREHITWLGRFFPEQVTGLLEGLLGHIASASSGSLGLAIATSVVVAVVGLERAITATMSALARISHVRPHRTFVQRHATGLALTLIGVVLGVGGLLTLVALPRLVGFLDWRGDLWDTVQVVRWPVLFVLAAGYLTLLYRLSSGERAVGWLGALIGASVAAALWLVASWALSLWVDGVSDYPAMYGAAGSFLVVLLWFYLGALAVLLGGIMAAEVRRPSRTPQPST